MRQLTVRAVIAGMLLGGFMSLSNLYVVLKTGWSFGVSITAGILAFAIFAVLHKVRIVKEPFGMLENNAMQSVASAAGYMTGGGTVAAIPALMMITGQAMGGWQMFAWISAIALMGVVMAIPMKQQMIDIEGLRFPTGVAAAETLRALHASTHPDENGEKAESGNEAKILGWSGLVGALLAWFRDAHASWMPFNTPAKIPFGWGDLEPKIGGRPLSEWTVSMEGSLLLVAGGALMGMRAAVSLLLGAALNYLVLAPMMVEQGAIEKVSYKGIVAWSVWPGAAMILTSGLLSFAFQWRTVLRAVESVAAAFKGKVLEDEKGQVPMLWFFIGMVVLTPVMVFLEWFLFGIKWWMGIISVILGFFIAIVACRATGETDTTPTGALGKITQITFGILDPGNVTTNLMTANVTGGMGLHAADLLTDLKSGYLLKADPRQQFWAQFFGVCAGSLCVVPAYQLLIPDASVLGGDKWPAPGAQTWKGVAELLAKGFHTLHPTAQTALWVGATLGVVLVLLEKALPKYKHWIPSPTGLGLAFTTPAYNCVSMFVGALLAWIFDKTRKEVAEKAVVPMSSGLIAGESLVGILIAILVVAGLLES